MNGIGCCVCLNIKGQRGKAVAVINGYSACEAHLDVVSNPNFDIALLLGGRKKK